MVTRRETGYRGLVAAGAVLVVVVLSSCGRNHAEEPAPAQPLPVTTKTAAFDGGIVAVTTIGLPPDLAARGIDAIATCPAAAFWFSAATLDVVTCGSPSVVRNISATSNPVDLVITPDTNGSDGSVAAIGLVLNTRVTLPRPWMPPARSTSPSKVRTWPTSRHRADPPHAPERRPRRAALTPTSQTWDGHLTVGRRTGKPV